MIYNGKCYLADSWASIMSRFIFITFYCLDLFFHLLLTSRKQNYNGRTFWLHCRGGFGLLSSYPASQEILLSSDE